MDQWNNVSQKVLKTSLPKYNSMWAYVFHCVCVRAYICNDREPYMAKYM